MPKIRFEFLALAAVGLVASGCDTWATKAVPIAATSADSAASIVVGSDLHYFSPGLMTDTSSAAFKTYLASDRKMIVQSPELLHSFLDSVRARRPRVLLLTGDLTKDGEKQSHQELADSLATLRALGIKVYVIPGNHDVYNPETYSYTSSGATKVSNVTNLEFASIYHDCGFDQAISRDTASLSYVVEPVPGLWLFALDPTRWKDNIGASSETVGGRFLPATTSWIRKQLDLASNGKTVVGAMHHGIVEHFSGQSTNAISADYVVAGFDTLDTLFANHGLHVVFTGHFHANDITTRTLASGKILTDIETGSLVTSPSPFRYGKLAGGVATLHTSRINEIRSMGSSVFPTWSKTFLLDGMTALTQYQLVHAYGVDSTTAASISPVVAGAYAAHYAGDETITTTASTLVAYLNSMGTTTTTYLAGSIKSLYTDLTPADSAGSFSLK
jgi:3',5'-cyclic AMP phosphodiesterase CpdA